jgi:hypothetical protein
MSKPADRIRAHCNLTQSVTQAVVDALAAGMTKEEAAAVLTRLAEILESED